MSPVRSTPNNFSIKSVFLFSGAGCLVLLLILSNFLFGWIFLDLKTWLISEAVLVIIFILNSFIITRRVTKVMRSNERVIDVEGTVIKEENKRLD